MSVPYSIWEIFSVDYAKSNRIDIALSAKANKDSTVNVSMHVWNVPTPGDRYIRHNWTMYLQRRDSKGNWNTIGTRTGYLTVDSPSHRTFTASKTHYAIRIRLRFENYGGSGYVYYTSSRFFQPL